MCSPGSAIIPPPVSTNSCPGTGGPSTHSQPDSSTPRSPPDGYDEGSRLSSASASIPISAADERRTLLSQLSGGPGSLPTSLMRFAQLNVADTPAVSLLSQFSA